VVLRIHSMELKGSGSEVQGSGVQALNPFNGIERWDWGYAW